MKFSRIFGSNSSSSTLKEVTEKIGQLGVSIAGVSGNVHDTSTELEQQATILDSLAAGVSQIAQQARASLSFVQNSSELAQNAQRVSQTMSDELGQTLVQATDLASGVKDIGQRLDGIQLTLSKVREISSEIESISQRTSLLSLNATVEAARAGQSGKGFQVVAAEFKALSEYTSKSTIEISDTLDALTKEIQTLAKQTQASVSTATTLEENTQGIGTRLSDMPNSLENVVSAQQSILVNFREIGDAVDKIESETQHLSTGLRNSTHNVQDANEELDVLRDLSEYIISQTSKLGSASSDTPFIQAAQSTAKQIGEIFETAVKNNEIITSDLFDRDYAPIQGTDPQQFSTQYLRFLDQVLPDVQEPVLEISDRMVFCAAVDVNGFLPTHNKKFSHPQRHSDPKWNAAHSRNRRIFNDRVGLAAGRNTDPFLVQAYRRDMGNNEYALMKDVSAPIFVNGRHWGGVRVAYRA